MSSKLKAKLFDIDTGKNIIIINEYFAAENEIFIMDRVSVKKGDKEVVAIVDFSDTLVKKNEIGLFEEIRKELGVKKGDNLEISLTPRPKSVEHIRAKMDGATLDDKAISLIITDLMDGKLSEAEASAFVCAVYIRGLNIEETVALTNAIVSTGEQLVLPKEMHPIADKHCLPFDTPLVVKNGSNVKVKSIGDLVESKFKLTKNTKKDGAAEYVEADGVEAISFDDDLKMVSEPIKRFYKVKAPKLMRKVVLQGNRKVVCTNDHSIFTLRKGKVMNVPSGALRPGDFVIVPNKRDFESRTMQDFTLNLPATKKKFNTELKVSPELMRFLG
ncbi:MAG: hypothetical protein GOV15_03355, partial [Candidatus Diapherotrites archaeon]|nr:hypothetical protein [Candidatus Diapherotrites archaeon]